MRLLLDTHAFLWWLQGSPRLSALARRQLTDPAAIVHVSAASIWELAIKATLGRLAVGRVDFAAEISESNFVELPISARHAWKAGRLPRHHDDPFDRMLAAQAELEGLSVVTHDPIFRRYAVDVLPT